MHRLTFPARGVVVAWVLTAGVAAAEAPTQPAPPAAAVPTPAGAETLGRGRAYAGQFYREELAQLRERFTERFAAEMTAAQLAEMRGRVSQELGAESAVIAEDVVPRGEFTVYRRRAKFARAEAPAELLVAMRADGAIAGILVRSATEAPPAATAAPPAR